jgi:DNA-binding NarL/FixJ family response regulator
MTERPVKKKQRKDSNIRIVIADDHRTFAEALGTAIRLEDDLSVVAVVHDGESAIEVAMTKDPDVVIMDVEMPGVDGIAATRKIKEANPDTHIVIVSAHEEEHTRAKAIDAGAEGYVTKEEGIKELTSSVRAAARGERMFSPEETRRILDHLRKRRARDAADRERAERLTKRETEILQGLADGMPTERLAEQMGITRNTLRTHVQNILFKLKVHSKVEALALAIRHGKVRPGEPT